MIDHTLTCDDSRLSVLLHGDENSDDYLHTARHVESCDVCCQRLSELAGDGETWTEVAESLRAEPVSFVKAKEQLDFLRPPSHPEMLGRMGRYEIERVIGTGGMGVVLKAHDSELNRPVAIKVLAPHLSPSGPARQRFAREGRAAAAIVHEHVVAIHNVESEAEVPFLVMQLVPGRSLQIRVDEDGPLGLQELLRIAVQTADGLAAAHAQGVIHRDVKPSNILLENDVERVLLTDFGLARVADDATMTRSGVVAGTPHYMSPEQASGAEIDPRSDLFSFGAVLYFMATGHPPFRAERTMAVLNRITHDRQRPVWQVNPEIPIELSDLIDRLLEKKPQRRFASAEDAQAALERILRDSLRPRRRMKSQLRRWWRHQRTRILTLATVVALAGAAVFAFAPVDAGSGVETAESGSPPVKTAAPEAPSNPAKPRGIADPDFNAIQLQIQRDLNAIEANVSRSGGIIQTGTAAWDAEISSIQRELSRLESELKTQRPRRRPTAPIESPSAGPNRPGQFRRN